MPGRLTAHQAATGQEAKVPAGQDESLYQRPEAGQSLEISRQWMARNGCSVPIGGDRYIDGIPASDSACTREGRAKR